MFSWTKKKEWKYDDLKTPIVDEEYLKLAKDSLDERLEWIKRMDFRKLSTSYDNVLLEEGDVPGSSITMVRASAILYNVSIEKLWKVAFSSSLEEKKEVFDDVIFHDKVKTINNDVHVAFSKYSAPTGIYPREFLSLRAHKQLDDGSHLIAVESINMEDYPFSDNFVRGVSMSGTLIIPLKNDEITGHSRIKIITVDHIEPKGWIPTFVINAFKNKAAERLHIIQKLYTSK